LCCLLLTWALTTIRNKNIIEGEGITVTTHSCLLMEQCDGEGKRDKCYFQAVKRLSPSPTLAQHDHSMTGGIAEGCETASSSMFALQID